MEKFLVLSTLTDQALANHTCAALEEAEIPVMIEHVIIQDEWESASGFRVLVPAEHAQTAMTVIDKAATAYESVLRRTAQQEEWSGTRPV